MTIKDLNYLKLYSDQDNSRIFELIVDDHKGVIGISKGADKSIIELSPMDTIQFAYMLDKLINKQDFNNFGINGYDYKNDQVNTIYFNYKKIEGQRDLLYQFDLITDIYGKRNQYDITLKKSQIQQILFHLCGFANITNERIENG